MPPKNLYFHPGVTPWLVLTGAVRPTP